MSLNAIIFIYSANCTQHGGCIHHQVQMAWASNTEKETISEFPTEK